MLIGLLAAGGLGGSVAGRALGKALETRKKILETGFALLVIAIGIFVVAKGLASF